MPSSDVESRCHSLSCDSATAMAVPLGVLRGQKLLAEVFAPESAPADFPMRAGGLLGLRPKAFYATSSDLMAVEAVLPGYVARYKGLNIPMAMLYGRGDRLLDYRAQGETMKATCPALDLEVMDGGHMLPMTVPDRCVAMVRRVADERGAGVVLVEQHVGLALDVADQAMVLVHGDVVLSGPVSGLRADMAALDAAYLGDGGGSEHQ